MTNPQRAEFNPTRTVRWTWWVALLVGVVHAQLAEQWWWLPIWFVSWFAGLLAWAAVRAVVDARLERREADGIR